MSQISRTDLTSVIESLIYDNNNKEVTAENVRSVLKDFRDSNFNIKDDQLKGLKYNETQTLEQYLNAVIGSTPVFGAVSGIDVGGAQSNLSTSGIISSASSIKSGSDSLVTINFSQSVSNRRLIPVLKSTSLNWSDQNDICAPVITIVSSSRINVGLREVSGNYQDLILEIIAI